MSAEKLLVVDDEPDFGEFVRTVAADMGFDVTVVDRGDAFKKTYLELRPSVLVLDIIMPYTDGIELLMWLAEQNCTSKIVIATGYTSDYGLLAEKLGKASGLAMSTVLHKPMTPSQLRAALTE